MELAHIDSEDIHMAEVTIELGDGTPSQAEANLDYWVDTVKRFCPWQAKLVGVDIIAELELWQRRKYAISRHSRTAQRRA